MLVVASDRKILVDNAHAFQYYEADVYSLTDYYPFGMQMTGRTASLYLDTTSQNVTLQMDMDACTTCVKVDSYRFGFNTQEKTPELHENHYTAEYWEYDARVARRWNTDPKMITGISPYACFAGNPIVFSDVKGDTIFIEGNKAQQKQVLHYMQKLTNDKLKLRGNMVVITKLGSENTDKNLPAGTNLIRKLNSKGQEGVKSVTIYWMDSESVFSRNVSATMPEDGVAAVNGKGTNSTVNFNPLYASSATHWELGGNGESVAVPFIEAEIVLGHELIHAKHNWEGTARPDRDKSMNMFPTSLSVSEIKGGVKRTLYPGSIIHGQKYMFQLERTEELSTVGLGINIGVSTMDSNNSKGDITENMIRREQGERLRTVY